MSDPIEAWSPDLESRLAVLRSELAKNGWDHGELPLSGTPVDCYVGVELGGSSWIRITCEPDSVSTDDRSALVDFLVKPNGYRVRVAPQAAAPVVSHFLQEVVDLVKSGYPPGDAGRAALQAWRDLLARPAGAPLSPSALVGLFGELEVLTTVLRHGGELDYWTGWDTDHCDFRLPGLVVEVKSTTSANYRRVRIHGLGQLADPEDGSRLVLVLRRLEISPEGRSIPDLTDEIVGLGASRSVLLDRLSTVGYSEQHRGDYERLRFVSSEVALRNVDDSHPRLVPQMLTGVDLSSIDKIDYELNLNGVADADVETTLEDLIVQNLEK